MASTIGPRLFGIPATRAPVVAVLRRGPSGWSHVGRWDVERGTYEAGSWIKGNLYPQRCDLSPDGRWLCYFTLRGGRGREGWNAGATYVAISRLPWLTALAAWGTCGTWTRGIHFVERRRTWEVEAPDEGDAEPVRRRFGLEFTRPSSFAVERRRGWAETADTPPRDVDNDPWDERRRRVAMERPRPGTTGTFLTVDGHFAAFRAGTGWQEVAYTVRTAAGEELLADVQWADWDANGRLLVATASGRLQVRREPWDSGSVEGDIDLAGMAPDPQAPPAQARQW